jgi:hypothetical protein
MCGFVFVCVLYTAFCINKVFTVDSIVVLILELGMKGGGLITPCPSSFTSQGRAPPLPIQQENGRASDPVWLPCRKTTYLPCQESKV